MGQLDKDKWLGSYSQFFPHEFRSMAEKQRDFCEKVLDCPNIFEDTKKEYRVFYAETNVMMNRLHKAHR